MNRILAIFLLAIGPYSAISQNATVNGIPNQNSSISSGAVPMMYLDPNAIIGNVSQYSFGENVYSLSPVPISGVASTSPFYGVNTLAKLAAMTLGNGYHPFFFATDTSGLAAYECGSTDNCFTRAGGYYAMTDAGVPALDIRRLAVQAAALTGNIFWGRPIVLDKVVMLPITGDGSNRSFTMSSLGKNAAASAATDFGANRYLFMVGDPAATPSSLTGRWSTVRDNGLAGRIYNVALVNTGTYPTISAPGWQMGGMALATHWLTADLIYAQGWARGVSFTGDHTDIRSLYLPLNYDGLYWDSPNGVLVGNVTLGDFRAESYHSGMAINGAATASYVNYGNQYLAAPIPWFCETGTASCINGLTAQTTQTEYTALAVIGEQANMPGQGSNGSSYVDSAKQRSVVQAHFGVWLNIFSGGQDSQFASSFPNYRRRATIDVNALYGFTACFQSTGQNSTPNLPGGTINAPVGFLNVNTLSGVDLTCDPQDMINKLDIITAGTTAPTPIVNTSLANNQAHTFTLHQDGEWDGRVMSVGSGNGSFTTTNLGDCYEMSNGAAYPCGVSNGSQPFAGAGLMGGIVLSPSTFVYLPIVTKGYANLIAGYNPFVTTAFKTSTGTGNIQIMSPGSGGTNGTYTITATGPCATQDVLSVTVSGGAITAATKTTQGYGCTGIPTYSTAGITGISGATLNATWPSGQVSPISNGGAGFAIGAYGGYAGGNATLGTLYQGVIIR